jgi:hypothetical protein
VHDDELMRLRVETLFACDARGRMLRANDPDGTPAPRLFIARTLHSIIYRLHHSVPDALAHQLSVIIEAEPRTSDLRAPLAGAQALREALAGHAPLTGEGGGPAYRFSDEPVQPPDVVSVTPDDTHLVRDTFPWVTEPGWQPCFGVVRDGAAVSVCFSARSSARVAEAGVNTLPGFRGRGYAAAVTSAWAATMHAQGIIPLYSTSWDNLASQSVARRLGLHMFGADLHWR